MNQDGLPQRHGYTCQNGQDRDPSREYAGRRERTMDINCGYNRPPILITGINHA